MFAQCSQTLNLTKLKDYKSIEKVKISMPLNSAIKLIKKKYFVQKEELPSYEDDVKKYEYIVYSDHTKNSVLFSFNGGYDNKTKDKVYRLVIKNSIYKTPDGLQVGISVKELKTKAKIKSIDFNYNDGLFIISDDFDGGFLMDIDTQKKYNDFDIENPEMSTLPDEIKIKEIILF